MKTPALLRKRPRLSAPTFYLIAAALCAARLLLTSQQKLFLCPEESMLDDMLFYKFAQSIAAGEWLGAYGYLTLGKRALYAVWLALLNKTGVNVLFAGQLLAVSAAALAARALRPVTKDRFVRLLVLAFLLFSPNAYADFTLRVYRANISSSAALLFFAGCAGLILRARDGAAGKLFLWGALAGLGFAASWLLREEAAWLIPFALLSIIVSAYMILKRPDKEGISRSDTLKRTAALALSAVVALAGIGAYAWTNYSHYGRFVTSDLTSREFADAYGAMTRIIVPEDEKNPIVPVPLSSRDKLAEASPLFAELMPYLEADDFMRWQKDCGDGALEYSGGGFYWAVRNAASLAGYYETPQKAQDFFRALADETNDAADSGALGEVLPRRSGLNSPITADYIAPTLKASLESLARVASYTGLRCDPDNSYGSDAVIDEMQSFLHCEAQRETYTVTTETSASRKLVFWAVSERAAVSARLIDSSGGDVQNQANVSTAGDVYLDYLLAGDDLRYTSGARLTVFYSEPVAGAALALSDGETDLIVSIDQSASYPAEVVTEGGITYRVEYAGASPATSTQYGFAELWLYRIMRVITWLYRAMGVALFLAGTLALALSLAAFIKKKSLCGAGGVLCVCAGCLLSAALRIGMMAFADVSAFGLGVYTMYLADVYPLMTLWEICALALWLASHCETGGSEITNEVAQS